MFSISVETRFFAICADTEGELKIKLEQLKDRYTEVIKIVPKQRGCSCWTAYVR